MLYKETVAPGTLALIKELMDDELMVNFNLVGGTALSLLIGHRQSIDIDLFCDTSFDASTMAEHLQNKYQAEDIRTLKNGIFCYIRQVKVDILAHQYPLLKPIVMDEGIRMLSLEDIGAMKLSAITDSGQRLKDFVDLYKLLEFRPLSVLLEAFENKYPDVSGKIAIKAINFYDEILPQEIKFFGKKLTMDEISKRLYAATVDPKRIFKDKYQKQQVKKVILKKSRRRKL